MTGGGKAGCGGPPTICGLNSGQHSESIIKPLHMFMYCCCQHYRNFRVVQLFFYFFNHSTLNPTKDINDSSKRPIESFFIVYFQRSTARVFILWFLFFSVYVDASDICNELAFSLGEIGNSDMQRTWSIKVSSKKEFSRISVLILNLENSLLRLRSYLKCHLEP